jgi:hypothetical protein
MTDNPMFDNNRLGFKVGEYFVSFPPGDFVKEDSKGMYVMVDVYKMENDKPVKINNAIPPEVEQYINEELNRILSEAVDNESINK